MCCVVWGGYGCGLSEAVGRLYWEWHVLLSFPLSVLTATGLHAYGHVDTFCLLQAFIGTMPADVAAQAVH